MRSDQGCETAPIERKIEIDQTYSLNRIKQQLADVNIRAFWESLIIETSKS